MVHIPSYGIIYSWEPAESFEGSEDIINRFWERANLGGRDHHDMSLFEAGEEFLPTGPPRTLLYLPLYLCTHNIFIRTQGKTKISQT